GEGGGLPGGGGGWRGPQPLWTHKKKRRKRAPPRRLLAGRPRGGVLPGAGRGMLEHARRVLAELHDARRRVSEVGGQVTGALALGAIPTIAPFLLPPVMRSFLGRWPGVRVSVTEDVTARLLARVGHGELDLAVI